MKPKNVKTRKDICNLKRDNWSYKNFTLGFNSEKEIYLHEQKIGEPCTQSFIIPLKVLIYFINKLNTESKK